MAQSDADTSICFPGEDRWELWRLKGGRFELADTAAADETGHFEAFKSATHYAFPVNSVYAVPLWVGSDDPAILPDLVSMQLEKQGLKPDPSPGMLLDYRKVGSGEVVGRAPEGGGAPVARSLLLATVLNPNYQHPLPKSGCKEFDVSSRFLVLPGNHIVIWKELGRLVMALTRGGQLVYFQGLSSGELDPATVQEIKCVLLGLAGQGVAAEPTGIHLWVEDVEDAAGAMLQDELGLDAIVTLRPDPVLPATPSPLLPSAVALERAARSRAAKIRNVCLALAGCYLAFLGWYLFGYFEVVQEERKLAAKANELAPRASEIKPFRSKWMDLEPLLDKNFYPSDIIHRITATLPAQGVNFTSFSMQGGTVTIIGECSSTTVAYPFFTALSKSARLQDFDWIWLQRPQVDPRKKDNTATFRIQGKNKFMSSVKA